MGHTVSSSGQQPLFRLRYGGSAHSFGFALYSHASERYEDAVLLTGYPTGTEGLKGAPTKSKAVKTKSVFPNGPWMTPGAH